MTKIEGADGGLLARDVAARLSVRTHPKLRGYGNQSPASRLPRAVSLVEPHSNGCNTWNDVRTTLPTIFRVPLVKPGMTGWAQIHGLREEHDLTARIQHDIYYRFSRTTFDSYWPPIWPMHSPHTKSDHTIELSG